MADSLRAFALTLLPWHATFDAAALVFVVAYLSAQVAFCLALRRMAMHIPGPERMCNPLGLWLLVVPGLGAVASFGILHHVWHSATAATAAHHVPPPRGVVLGFVVLYGVSRLAILVPGLLVPALLLQSLAATGFLLRLGAVARLLRTEDIAVV
ncbi:MAG: hypothetical protein IT355_09240 [Gemmatimonadaceae bacterium]|nr:hypothetical protein [Gemmatimonadaceae bacterium]